MKKAQKPYQGEPRTKVVTLKDGTRRHDVTITEITPLRAKVADVTGFLISLLLFCGVLAALMSGA